jgi:lipoprotein-releasing system permease protein
MVAGRYLRARKAEGFVSVIAAFSFLGIMLGVATLIIVMSVMNGFRGELVGRIVGLNGHLNVYSVGGPLTDYRILEREVMEVPGVTGVGASIESQALLSVNGSASGVLVRGITPEDFEKKPILANAFIAGDIDNFKQGGVAVGKELAKHFDLKIGDSITLISPKGKATPFGSIPRSASYQIGAIFDVGMYEYNSGFVYMPMTEAQAFFQLPNAVTSLEIFTADPTRLDNVRRALETKMAGQATVADWRDQNGSFFNAVQVERNVMFMILTMIIIVAAFNIISSMIMLVKDKGHDIAIMRTMGATRSNMMKIFMLTGASIGIMGTLVGSILGISFALNIESIRRFIEGFTKTNLFSDEIYFLSHLPADLDWSQVTSIILMAFGLSILATIYPAWRAARMDPVEALRYE